MKQLITYIFSIMLLTALLIPNNASAQGQCLTGGCTAGGITYGSALTTTLSTFTPAMGCTYGGEYNTFNVTSGAIYEWSMCAVDGASVGNSDNQLTLKTTANVNLCYSDDYCGASAKIRWTATFTGQVRVMINAYNCVTNSTCNTMVWRMAVPPPSNCTITATTIASVPVINQAVVCTATNTLTSSNVNNPSACGGNTSYLGGLDGIYTFTPSVTNTYNIAYSGQSWSAIWVYSGCPTNGGTCVGYVGNSSTGKSLSVPMSAGVPYYFWFDTWPTPNSPCPGTFSLTIETCAVGTVISPASLPIVNQSVTCSASNVYSASNVVSTTCSGGSTAYLGGEDGIYRFTPTTTGAYSISYAGQSWTAIWVYQGCPTTAGSTCIGYASSSGTSKNLTVNLTAGVAYWFWFDTWPSPNSPCPGTFSLASAVNPCALGTVLSPASLPINNQALTCSVNNEYSASNVVNPTSCGGSTAYLGGQDAIYRFTPSASASYDINVSGQSWTAIWVYQGCPTSGGTCVGYFGSSATSNNLTVAMTAGIQYTIWFDTWPSPNSPCPGTFSISVAAPPPANDNCLNVTPTNLGAGGTVTFTGSTSSSTPDGPLTLPTVFHAVTLTGSCNNLEVSYCNTPIYQGTVYQVLSTTCPVSSVYPDPTYILASNAGNLFTCSSGNALIQYYNLPAGTYYIPVAGAPTGVYSVTVTSSACIPPPVNDFCAGALPLPCNGSVTGNTLLATDDTGLPMCGPGTLGGLTYFKGVWYTFTSPGSGTVSLSLCSSNLYDSYMAVFTGSCGSFSCVAGDDDACGLIGGLSSISFTATQGTTYYVLVAGWQSSSTGAFTLNTTCPPPCVSQPVAGTISGPSTGCTNQDLAYTAAGGNGNYQWEYSTTGVSGPFSDIPGQTSAVLTYSVNVAGTYYVRVRRSNPGCLDDYSNVLTVNLTDGVVPFSISTSSSTICPGTAVNLSIGASGPANAYIFSTATSVALEDMTGAVELLGSFNDDAASSPYSIGFPFKFNGADYSSFTATSNGLFSFGYATSTYQNAFVNATDFPSLLPMFDDLHTGDNGNVQYKLVGSAGSYKMVVEWNIRLYSGESGDATKRMQIWLHEGSNIVQFVYGADAGLGFNSASVGIASSTSQFNSITTGSNTSNTAVADDANTVWPGTGMSYIFSPPPPTGTIVWSSDIGGFSAYGAGPHSHSPAAPTTYTAQITILNGCMSSESSSVGLYPMPVPNAFNGGPYCEGGNASFTGLGGVSYQWAGPSGTIFSTSSNPTINGISLADGGMYTLTVTDGNGCSNSTTDYLQVNPNPVVDYVTESPETCFGSEDGTIEIGLSNGDGTYTTFDGGSLQSFNNPATFNPLAPGSYYFTVQDGAGCQTFASGTVGTDVVPPVITCPGNFNVSNDPGICGAVITYAPSATDFNNCPVSMYPIAGLPSGSVFPVGTTTNTWVAVDLAGYTDTCSFNVTVTDSEAPFISQVANIVACNNPGISWPQPSITDNCAGVQFSSTHAPGFTFPSGITTVTYTATDSRIPPNVSTMSFTVTVLEPSVAPVAIQSSRDFNNICLGENITLTVDGGSLGAGASWKWYSGSCGGTVVPGSAGLSSITVSPTATTTYFVRAEGTCNTTGCASVQVVVSTIAPSTSLTFSYLPAYGAPGVTDSIMVNPIPGAAYYQWSTNNGHINSLLFNGQVSPVQTSIPKVYVTYVLSQQNYQIRVLAGNACGRNVHTMDQIRGTVATPTSLSGPTQVCPLQTHSYTVAAIPSQSGNNAVSYNWTLIPSSAGTISGTGLTRTVTFAAGFTSAQLCVAGVSSFNLPGTPICINISTNAPAPGAISGLAAPCQGSTEVYTIAAVAGATGYVWGTNIAGATIPPSGTSASVTFPANSFSGLVWVKAQSSCGLSDSTAIAVASGVAGNPGTITGPTAGICGASNVNYAVLSSGASNYNWMLPAGVSFASGNGSNSVNLDFDANFAGGDIYVVATYACGTANTPAITVNGSPAAPTVLPATICPETAELYTASSTGATSYNWTITGDDYQNCTTPPSCNSYYVIWGMSGGSLSVTASNGCGTSAAFSVSTNCRITATGEMDTKVYPNPNTGQFVVEFTSYAGGNHNLTITDLSGRVVMQKDVAATSGLNQYPMDLEFANAGLYMLYVKDTTGKISIIKIAVE